MAVIHVLALASALFAVAFAEGSAVSPVEKVTTMLEDLQTQVIVEGKAEAKTYNKFACFCKDLTEQKNQAITDGQNQASELTAQIETNSADRQDLADKIAELSALIKQLTEEMAAAEARRKKEHIEFLKVEAELDLGVKELKGASAQIRHGTGGAASFAQDAALQELSLPTTLAHVEKRLHDRLLSQLLQDGSGTSNSGDIVQTIDDIETDFEKELKDCRDKEDKSRTDHRNLMTSKSEQKVEAESDLTDAKNRLGKKSNAIGQANRDLSATSATLLDDKAYLLDLTAKCNAKSAEWDQRSQMRTDEITAITTALHIIRGTVSEKTTEKTVRLVQIPQPARADDEADSTDDEVDDILDQEPSFLQVGQPRKTLAVLSAAAKEDTPRLSKFLMPSAAEESSRQKAIALLKARGADLKSETLVALAAQATADPFVKIRKLIQELIERLLQEAADEANHKGWCDKEIGKAEQKRVTKANAVKELNEMMAQNEAKRDQLNQEISELAAQIEELESALAKTDKERKEESLENTMTIEEAEDGRAAINQAIDVLSKFYKTAAKAELLQVSQPDDPSNVVDANAPDTGFSGAYKGSQGASTGIIGMMDVIKSDFDRTIEETQQQEKDANKEFHEFQLATKSSIGTKKVGKSNREQALAETVDALADEKDSLMEQQDMLDKSLQELTELQPACVDTGMSYQERVAKREQEVESLKQALCMLDNEGPVQTEPGCED